MDTKPDASVVYVPPPHAARAANSYRSSSPFSCLYQAEGIPKRYNRLACLSLKAYKTQILSVQIVWNY
jgi:succinyl-CoA synthetase alpha subunit